LAVEAHPRLLRQLGVCWCKLRTLRVRASSPAENIALDPQEGTRDSHWKPKGQDSGGESLLSKPVRGFFDSLEFTGANCVPFGYVRVLLRRTSRWILRKVLATRTGSPRGKIRAGRIGCRSPSAASSTAWSLLVQTPIVARNSSPQRPNRSPRGSLSPSASVRARGLLSNSVRRLTNFGTPVEESVFASCGKTQA